MDSIIKRTYPESIGNDLRETLSKMGVKAEYIDKIVAKYIRFCEIEVAGYIPPGVYVDELRLDDPEVKGNMFKKSKKVLEDILMDEVRRYTDYRKQITEAYKETGTWEGVYSKCAYQDTPEAEEAFIGAVEEAFNVKVKDAKHLSKLTGITNFYNYWDKDKGFLDDEEAEALAKKEKKPLESYEATEKQTGEEALRQLGETITGARYSRYSRSLTVAIENGAKYKDLLQIKPKEYDLPEAWEGTLGKDQNSCILWAIVFTFNLEGGYFMGLYPSLRDIANELEAPYSVVLDASKLV